MRGFVRSDPPPSTAEYAAEVRRFHDAARAVERLAEDEEIFGVCAVDTTGAKRALALGGTDSVFWVTASMICRASAREPSFACATSGVTEYATHGVERVGGLKRSLNTITGTPR